MQVNLEVYFTKEGFVVDDEANIDCISDLTWFQLGFRKDLDGFSPGLLFLYDIANQFIRQVCRQPDVPILRGEAIIPLTEETITYLLEAIPFAVGVEHIDGTWLQIQWDKLQAVLKGELNAYLGSVESYFENQHSHLHLAGKVFFHLADHHDPDHPFAFMATVIISEQHLPLSEALRLYEGQEQQLFALIATVLRVAKNSPFIQNLLDNGELFSAIWLSADEAYVFLTQVPIYEAEGIQCLIPKWWRKKHHQLTFQVTIGEEAPSVVGLGSLLSFKPELMLGDQPLSVDALSQFLNQADGLVRYKDQWMVVQQRHLQQIIEAFDHVKTHLDERLSLADALGLAVHLDASLGVNLKGIDVSVHHGTWLKKMKDLLKSPKSLETLSLSDTFKGVLRPYQQVGYAWMYRMMHFGFGALLADDMGLGKTVQVIALLETMRQESSKKVLLIVPASLLINWQNELTTFAPELLFHVLHASSNPIDIEATWQPEAFLTITTYGMALKLEPLRATQFDLVILDEAQLIKNPGAKQTKAIKAIPTLARIAMTGTPIENHLKDLWSLYDFLNPGLLGDQRTFLNYAKDTRHTHDHYERLRGVIGPFLLRRLKTDPNVISDLPEKIDYDTFVGLSSRQIALYEKVLKDLEDQLQKATGIGRKGLILSTLMHLKQICNHPDHYLGKKTFLPAYGGKFEPLRGICTTIHEKREKVLVFTQFKAMTGPLHAFLATIFKRQGFVLHGSTGIRQRGEMVHAFNTDPLVPFMVLSLKAGGVGLNLTGANHVIHFDRWWNPAVENQATDRAYRIGQTKQVMVHRLIAKGTIEEKIHLLMHQKTLLADDLLKGKGEQFVTEMTDEALLALCRLGGDSDGLL